MFDTIIRGSLRHAWLVIAGMLVLVGVGVYAQQTLPVDVLPELAAPSVTIVTETSGMAPEEVERLVTVPLEQAINGAPGLRRLRSSSGVGISLVWAEFDWDVLPQVARQIATEKLALARSALPPGVEPVIAPASSIMGEIMFVGVTSDDVAPGELRDIAEYSVRRRLLSVPGVAQVVPIGGEERRVEIVVDPTKLLAHRVSLDTVVDAMSSAARAAAGGFVVTGQQEYLVRGVGRPRSLAEIEKIRVGTSGDVPVLVGDVATVRLGAAQKRGEGALGGKPGVVLKVQKQPQANTLDTTARVDVALDEIARTLPEGVALYRKGFRQADFIRVALHNVTTVLRDGAILVALILVMFLFSWRTTLISLLALPLSLLAGLVVLRYAGASINTMTLGGFAIAIGELVDDAIIDVENVHRRLGEQRRLPPAERKPAIEVVYEASREIRSSVVYATLIILLVFAPLFFLSGIEGRLLRPLGIAYVTSIGASLVVALTITPVLCLLLLGRADADAPVSDKPIHSDSFLSRALKRAYRPVLRFIVRHAIAVGVSSLAGAIAAIIALSTFGRSFLPEFNEGSLNIAAATAPGTSLEASNEIVRRLERFLVEHPAVTSVIRSTGRAERDEHALDVNFSELEVGLDVGKYDREEVLADIREKAASIPGLAVAVGQPISHRIEHLVSGVRASIAVKIYGDDLDQLRSLAREAEAAMKVIPGIVDVNVEQQTEIPELVILPRPTELGAFGLTPGELAELTETIFVGRKVGDYFERDRTYDVVVRLPDAYQASPELLASTPIDVDARRFAPLSHVATLTKTTGPNLVNRENVQRRIVVTANVAGRDLRGAASDVLARVQRDVKLPTGYRVELGGEFESEAAASRTIGLLSIAAIVGVAALLYAAFRSGRDVAIVMFNLPLALVGGAIAVRLGGGTMTIASLVGFITLFGIATRNGIMMVTHFRQLLREGSTLSHAVVQGSVDRLAPILMTALTAALALVPIVLAAGEPGNEIQAPMSAVILGGLTSSTLLNLFVIPALFYRFSGVTRDAP